ncbi:Protein XAP5 CIRCADIAN TIMEKEEPER [Glycine soja]
MSGMGDGYVGTAQDAVRIRRLEKQREAERRKIQELKTKSASAKDQPGLLQFGSSTSEILETAFKKETVGLVTREQYVEKRVNIQSKIEEEEKEKLQKQQQEEEELQLQKRKKRKIRGNSRLSFAEDIDNEPQEDEPHHSKENFVMLLADNLEANRLRCGKLGKDPTVETSFLPDRSAEDSCSVSERLRSKLSVKGCANSGFVSRSKFEVRKGDSIGEFLRAVQQQLAPEFREIRTTSVENLLYVKEDLIIPHQHSFYELIVNKARGKSGPLFHFDVHEDVRTIADATIEKDESHAGKVVERHWYEKNKHIFPASRWEIYDPTKKWERYTIHGD